MKLEDGFINLTTSQGLVRIPFAIRYGLFLFNRYTFCLLEKEGLSFLNSSKLSSFKSNKSVLKSLKSP